MAISLEWSVKSSINCESGLGSSTLTAVYSGFLLGALFLPTVLIQKGSQIVFYRSFSLPIRGRRSAIWYQFENPFKRFGLKKTICFSILGYTFFAICSFVPSYERIQQLLLTNATELLRSCVIRKIVDIGTCGVYNRIICSIVMDSSCSIYYSNINRIRKFQSLLF